MTAKPAAENFEKKSGLGFLIEKLEALEKAPTLPDICGWLAEAEITDAEIAPYRKFSDEKYTRNRIFRNEFAEILILGWISEQESMIHDHDGSVGVIRVFEGEVTETKFRWDDNEKLVVASKQAVSKGLIAGVGEPDIHQLQSSGGQNTVTIHVYAPPLEGLHIYDLESREIIYYLLD